MEPKRIRGRLRGMKRILWILAALALTGAMAAAQDLPNAPAWKKLGLSEAEIRQVAAVQAESRVDLQKARAEIRIAKAQLAKLLLNADVSMADVEKVLRTAQESELAVRKIQIGRALKIRKIVGDERWGQMARPRIEAARKGQPQPLLQRLRNLLRGNPR
jgi:hypothetical protein